jgi:lyso-ornithine lipid O-acyltransferase
MIRYSGKIAAFFVLLFFYFLSSQFINCFSPTAERKRQRLISNTSRFCRVLLRLLGITVTLKHLEEMSTKQNCLLLANHLSYLDIVAISSVRPSIFVTSHEVRDLPIEGSLARCAGTIFVDRRSTSTLLKDIREISRLLRQGFTVALFPEATSSPGESVLPFKSALLSAALRARRDIIPVCINYEFINGDPVTKLNRDNIFYYGDMELLGHLGSLLKLHTVHLELVFLGGISSEVSARKEAAGMAFEAISRAYKRVR